MKSYRTLYTEANSNASRKKLNMIINYAAINYKAHWQSKKIVNGNRIWGTKVNMW